MLLRLFGLSRLFGLPRIFGLFAMPWLPGLFGLFGLLILVGSQVRGEDINTLQHFKKRERTPDKAQGQASDEPPRDACTHTRELARGGTQMT